MTNSYYGVKSTVCVGIGGGVGPAAGVALHKHIIEQTKSDGTDQSHLEVHHISRPDVADRTSYLLGKGDRNPGEDMAITMAALAESSLAAGKTSVVAGVPCNTFHAPPIWNSFMAKMRADGTDKVVHMVHMLEETASAITTILPGAKRVGLLSTTGTRKSRVYHNLLEPMGFEVVQVDEDMQDKVHDAIYNREWGVKAVQPTTDRATAAFAQFAHELVRKGAQIIILGCTEIPLALPGAFFQDVRLLDPMQVLARALVKRAGALTANIALPSCESQSIDFGVSPSWSRPTRWQQHAAAAVIQTVWRAYRGRKRAVQKQPSSENLVAMPCCSINSMFSPNGITPDNITPAVCRSLEALGISVEAEQGAVITELMT